MEGDTAELFLEVMSSDNFMAGWAARLEALRTKDRKEKKRILEDNRVAVKLVERVMARLHDASQEREDDP